MTVDNDERCYTMLSLNAFASSEPCFCYKFDDHCYSYTTMNMQPMCDSTLTSDSVDGSDQAVYSGGFTSSAVAFSGCTNTSPPKTLSSISNPTTINIQDRKKSLILDFNNQSSKKVGETPVLSTPELLQKIFAQPTTQSAETPTTVSLLFPSNVTIEQEEFAKPFIESLIQLHKSKNECVSSTTMLSSDGFKLVNDQQSSALNSSEVVSDQNQPCNFLSSSSLVQSSDCTTTSLLPELSSGGNLPISRPHSSQPVFLSVSKNGANIPLALLAAPLVKQERASPASFNISPRDRCDSASSSCSASSYTSTSSCNSSNQMNYNHLAQQVAFGVQPTSMLSGNMLPTSHFVTIGNNDGDQPLNGLNGSRANVKREDMQTVPNLRNVHSSSFAGAAGISPMDPYSQEKLKLERKRLRNRIAATKCRKRKIERIETLEAQVREVSDQNGQIEQDILAHQQEIANLRQIIKEHMNKGCTIPLSGIINGGRGNVSL